MAGSAGEHQLVGHAVFLGVQQVGAMDIISEFPFQMRYVRCNLEKRTIRDRT
jgi:hypothetical protein